MEQITDNMQKYANYKEQMGRLSKALTQGFFWKRSLSSMRFWKTGWNPSCATAENGIRMQRTLCHWIKAENVAKLAEEKKSLAHKYFPPELTDRIDVWKGARNKIIHALMKQDLHTEDLSAVALDGQALVKTLCSKPRFTTVRWNGRPIRRTENEQICH